MATFALQALPETAAGWLDVARNAEVNADEADLVACPYVLVGTQGEIAAKLRDVESRWGISRFAVRPPAIDGVASILGSDH